MPKEPKGPRKSSSKKLPKLNETFDSDDISRIRRRKMKRGDYVVKYVWSQRNSKDFDTLLQWYRIAKEEGFPSYFKGDSRDLTTFDFLLNTIAGRSPYDEFQRGETVR